MNLLVLGRARVGGGCLFVAVGNPGVAIEWEMTGPGALLPLSDVTNANGVATAKWDATGGTPAVENDTVTVTVKAWP